MSDAPSGPENVVATKPRGVAGWVQGLGFALGLGMLAWCIWLVAKDQARIDQVKKLAQSPGTLAVLLALSTGVSLCTGMMFRAMAAPVAKLPVLDVLAVNAVATLLGNLPFKLSIVARGYLHRTRNGMPVPLILAWMGASLCVMAIGVLPPLVATFALKRIDATWWITVVAGTVLLAACGIAFARVTGTERFWGWVSAQGERFPGSLGKLTRWSGYDQFRRGPEMLGSVPAVAQGVAWRSASMGLGVWRFAVAAAAVGATMTAGQCVVADSAYFMIQATAPTGALGAREGGTVAVVASLAGESLPVVVLAVTAAETVANLLCAGAGLMYLKMTRASVSRAPEPRP